MIDRECEDEVFAELEKLGAEGASFVAVSEERGEVVFGDGGAARVVIDPIDGSLNARRTIPSHSLSIAVAYGDSMADVASASSTTSAPTRSSSRRRGEGATVGGRAARVAAGNGKLEVVGLESAEPDWTIPALQSLSGNAYRLRVVGSIAITAAYVAAGRFDAFLSLRPCRSVDAAAAQLIVREAGGAVAFGDGGLADAPLDLSARYPMAAARDAEALAAVRAAQVACRGNGRSRRPSSPAAARLDDPGVCSGGPLAARGRLARRPWASMREHRCRDVARRRSFDVTFLSLTAVPRESTPPRARADRAASPGGCRVSFGDGDAGRLSRIDLHVRSLDGCRVATTRPVTAVRARPSQA